MRSAIQTWSAESSSARSACGAHVANETETIRSIRGRLSGRDGGVVRSFGRWIARRSPNRATSGEIMSQLRSPTVSPATRLVNWASASRSYEREASAISGWLGVLVVAGCIAAVYLLDQHSAGAIVIIPVVVGIVILASLVIVQPGETRSSASSAAMSAPSVAPASRGSCPQRPAEGEHPGQELRDEPPEGERR